MTKDDLIKAAKILFSKSIYGNDFWSQKRQELVHSILHDNIDNFLSWQVIKNTMYVTGSTYAPQEYTKIINTKFKNQLVVSKVGGPSPIPSDFNSCENLTHMLYHLYSFESLTNTNIEDNKSVIEFGGGYGCMAKIIKERSPSTKYCIVDFPEFNLLQKYYLSQHNINDVTFISNLDNVNIDADLLIATWSLSEAPIEVRQKFLSKVHLKKFLLAYQVNFFDIDNDVFFNEFTKNYNKKWIKGKISHLPPTQYYLFGI